MLTGVEPTVVTSKPSCALTLTVVVRLAALFCVDIIISPWFADAAGLYNNEFVDPADPSNVKSNVSAGNIFIPPLTSVVPLVFQNDYCLQIINLVFDSC